MATQKGWLNALRLFPLSQKSLKKNTKVKRFKQFGLA